MTRARAGRQRRASGCLDARVRRRQGAAGGKRNGIITRTCGVVKTSAMRVVRIQEGAMATGAMGAV